MCEFLSVRTVHEGDLLWTPSAERIDRANITAFQRWLGEGNDPRALWRSSVEDLDGFWGALHRWSGVPFSALPRAVLEDARMPGASWFPGATLNYAQAALNHPPDDVAVVHLDEDGNGGELTYGELTELVRRCAAGLRRLGIGEGHRVAAYAPNRPETLVAFLATASLGAIWTACSPDFGSRSVLDRFGQVEPDVLIACEGYRYGGQDHDRRDVAADLAGALPSVRATVVLDRDWVSLVAPTGDPLEFRPVAFDHPLWVVYTSGTTGLPKSIVHGHGGVVLEHHKLLRLHLDLDRSDRFCWYTTTGWVMWNIVAGALLIGAAAVLYDGNPAHPTPGRLWEVGSQTGATFLGTSAAYVHACLRAGVDPRASTDLSELRAVGVTGSPLSPSGNAWLYGALAPDLFVASISGGTDVCTAFVGSIPVLPVRAGHIQHPCLGVAATAFDEAGGEVIGDVGELVITRPMPSMPVSFWGADGPERYRASYFDSYPGVWRHGDWVRFDEDGSCVVLGRSDATLNRGGVRMGSSEFYTVLDTIPGVTDSLVIDTTVAGSAGGDLVLLVAPEAVSDEMRDTIRRTLRSELSPRHVPDHIIGVAALPHTLNGKRLEVPVRRMFLGADPSSVVDRSAIDDPRALDAVARVAAAWNAQPVR